ncbi:MAG: hypothetical protein M0Q92_05845 [Methanoregula sp.]|nr:hypothetical protein [Methanoregula sp.]
MRRFASMGFLAFMLVTAVFIAGCTDSGKTTALPTTVPAGQSGQALTVPYGEDVPVTLDSPTSSEVYLTMTARANSEKPGGGRSFMRISVNGKEIGSERLVNKNLNFTYNINDFRTAYYSQNMSAWYLFFSPDFVWYANQNHVDYISEGNPYEYKFEVTDIVNRGAPNEIIIENIGDEVAAQYSNPSDIEFYKSAPIIINPIRLEGKGTDVVQITKTATPTRIIVGKKSVVTLTVKNDLPGSISDVEIDDADVPSGLIGKTVTGKLEKPIASGETYTVTYEVTADKVGTYTLGAATMTFADSTGNYQKLSSGTMTVTVI